MLNMLREARVAGVAAITCKEFSGLYDGRQRSTNTLERGDKRQLLQSAGQYF